MFTALRSRACCTAVFPKNTDRGIKKAECLVFALALFTNRLYRYQNLCAGGHPLLLCGDERRSASDEHPPYSFRGKSKQQTTPNQACAEKKIPKQDQNKKKQNRKAESRLLSPGATIKPVSCRPFSRPPD